MNVVCKVNEVDIEVYDNQEVAIYQESAHESTLKIGGFYVSVYLRSPLLFTHVYHFTYYL